MLAPPSAIRILQIYEVCPRCRGQLLLFSDGLGCLQCGYRPRPKIEVKILKTFRNNGGKRNG